MALEMTFEEKEHYAEVMFNKHYDKLTEQEKNNIQSYYEQETEYIEIMTKYGESGISNSIRSIFI